MKIVPSSITAARRFVAEHHRHNAPPPSGLFAVGLADDGGTVIGVAIVGRPVARMLDDGATCEVTRLCTLGHRNACTMLYGACSRAAKALGWSRIITYTLAREPGTALKAAGWTCESAVKGRSWDTPSREREVVATDLFGARWKYMPEDKWRWERVLR